MNHKWKTFILFSLLFFCLPVFLELFSTIERKLFTFLSRSTSIFFAIAFPRQAFWLLHSNSLEEEIDNEMNLIEILFRLHFLSIFQFLCMCCCLTVSDRLWVCSFFFLTSLWYQIFIFIYLLLLFPFYSQSHSVLLSMLIQFFFSQIAKSMKNSSIDLRLDVLFCCVCGRWEG